MNNEELDSQLSAMFDGELPPAQCELVARRLSRDEELKARWGRYAVISAAIRAERGVRLDCSVAGRVSAALRVEPALTPTAAPLRDPAGARMRWWRPAAGIAVAVAVAAVALLWLRQQGPAPGDALVARQTPPAAVADTPAVGDAVEEDLPDTYVVPMRSDSRTIVPPAELANYVVAHSEFSAPLSRRNLLSALMHSEPGTATPAEESEVAFEESEDHAEGAQ